MALHRFHHYYLHELVPIQMNLMAKRAMGHLLMHQCGHHSFAKVIIIIAVQQQYHDFESWARQPQSVIGHQSHFGHLFDLQLYTVFRVEPCQMLVGIFYRRFYMRWPQLGDRSYPASLFVYFIINQFQ